MKQLTEQEAREAFNALTFEEVVEYAEQQGKPTAGQSKEALIEMLLGKCAGCKGTKTLTVVVISAHTKKKVTTNNKMGGAPCGGCGK